MMRMKIFGGGAILYDEQVSVDEKKLHSNKLIRLLVYILLCRDRELTHQELIDTFWQDDGSRNPVGALKNLIYRLRSELKVFGDQELILTLPGAYRWNPQVPVETDYEELERTAKEAHSAVDEEQKKLLCEMAVNIYKKEVLPRIASESWMLPRLTYYKLLYIDTVKMLSEIYEKSGSWDAMEVLCLRALEIDSLEEDIHYWLIKSQIGKGKYDTAISYYEKGKKLFYDNFGIRDIERFNELYDEIMSLTRNRMSDINSLMKSVCEKEEPTGVFVCEYPIFREIYRVEARRIQRTGIAEYVLLITMKQNGKVREDARQERINSGMSILGDILRITLRSGDVVARYNSTQYVLLLPGCTYESTLQIADRIDRKFRSEAGKRRLSLQFEVEELLATAGV